MSAFRTRRLRRSSRGADRQAILTRANRVESAQGRRRRDEPSAVAHQAGNVAKFRLFNLVSDVRQEDRIGKPDRDLT
jgi:hypothetical protein